MAYVTAADFADYLRNELGQTDATHSASALAAAKQAIDMYCQRSFDVAGSAAAKTFPSSPYGSILRIPDCTTVTSVTIGGVTISSAEYQLEPLSSQSFDGVTRPYTQIRRPGYAWWSASTLDDIIVTATWGWTATPAAVVEACKILGKGIVELRNARGGVVASDAFGPVRAPRDTLASVRSLLDPFRRVEAIGVA